MKVVEVPEKHTKDIAPILSTLGADDVKALEVSGICYDSRSVGPGDAFFCIAGERVDGHAFIQEAISRGAACTVSERACADAAVPHVVVRDARRALALVADYFFDHPSERLRPLGVTGTNGKTTTTHLVERIINEAGKSAGLIGTLGARWGGASDYINIKHTTPQSSDLHEMLFYMAQSACTHVAMEVSSHALVQDRVAGCQFAVACLTNVSQDHLDFHKTMEHYWRSKKVLFELVSESSHNNKAAIINADDPLASQFANACTSSVRKLMYSFDKPTDIYVKRASFDFKGTDLSLVTPCGSVNLKLKLTGRFNVYNVMAAMGICLAEEISLEQCAQSLEGFSGVPGRFEVVSGGLEDEPLCIVDYAHTPDGLDNVLRTARHLVPEGGKLLAVFGCGGDRDASKRPQMGEIAEALADVVFVTSDNPRSEDPQTIIANILAGIKRMRAVKVEPDRSSAIKLAVKGASGKDVVVVAGKGHENYQILKDRTIPFDDRTEVRAALDERRLAPAADQS